MLKNLREILFHNFYESNTTENIRKINIPLYYNFSEMLDTLLEMSTGNNGIPTPERLTIICVTKTNYRIAIQKGFYAVYLYDHLDFTDKDYYVIKPIATFGYALLENSNTISYSLIKDLHNNMPASTIFFVLYDNMIPRKYMEYNDVAPFYENVYSVSRISSDKNMMNSTIRHFLNFIRQKNNTLDMCFIGGNKEIKREKIYSFDLGLYLDISKPIITPHITLLNILNWKIRMFLGIIDHDDPFMPQIGEYMVCDRAVEITDTASGEKHVLPIGYRFKVKSSKLDRHDAYVITLDHELPDGKIIEAITYASKRYLEYMQNGNSELEHAPYSYCINYGYVVLNTYSVNEEYPEGIVLFDSTLCIDKMELYTSILPIKRELKILYNDEIRINI